MEAAVDETAVVTETPVTWEELHAQLVILSNVLQSKNMQTIGMQGFTGNPYSDYHAAHKPDGEGRTSTVEVRFWAPKLTVGYDKFRVTTNAQLAQVVVYSHHDTRICILRDRPSSLTDEILEKLVAKVRSKIKLLS